MLHLGLRLHVVALLLALAAVSACGDSGSDSEPTSTTTLSAPTIQVVESPTAADCDAAAVPGAAPAGEQATIQGTVVGTSVSEDERGRSIVLELGLAGGGAAYAVAIPESAAQEFSEPPQEAYDGKLICVRGTVVEHRGVATIFVSTPAEIAEREPSDE